MIFEKSSPSGIPGGRDSVFRFVQIAVFARRHFRLLSEYPDEVIRILKSAVVGDLGDFQFLPAAQQELCGIHAQMQQIIRHRNAEFMMKQCGRIRAVDVQFIANRGTIDPAMEIVLQKPSDPEQYRMPAAMPSRL